MESSGTITAFGEEINSSTGAKSLWTRDMEEMWQGQAGDKRAKNSPSAIGQPFAKIAAHRLGHRLGGFVAPFA